MKNKDIQLIEEARKLRMDGLSFCEISKIINVGNRRIKYWTKDIKLSKEQIIGNISRIKLLSAEKRYESAIVDKDDLLLSLENNGFYKTVRLMGLTEGTVKYWCKKYDIKINVHKVLKPNYDKCCLCNKPYEDSHIAKRKICNTCVSKLRRRESKIRAINYLGGRCNRCGYSMTDINFAAFEFHHPENNKEKSIGETLNRKWSFILLELNKCELLCSNCHRIEHSDYQNTKIIQLVKENYVKNNEYIQQTVIDMIHDQNGIGIDAKVNDIINGVNMADMVKTESINKIAQKLGISYNSIVMFCKTNNISIPKKHYLLKRFDVDKEKLETLVKEKPLTEIGKIFGVSDNAIRKRCRSYGIDLKLVSPFSHSKNIGTDKNV